MDINIHPRKEEVQFLHPRRIETALTNAITQALEKHLTMQIHAIRHFPTKMTDDGLTHHFTQQ